MRSSKAVDVVACTIEMDVQSQMHPGLGKQRSASGPSPRRRGGRWARETMSSVRVPTRGSARHVSVPDFCTLTRRSHRRETDRNGKKGICPLQPKMESNSTRN
ncbi:hypothetical protein CRG98_023386 [Punica granatum]|uniref:Uncharacterized protein n=1 Tax=Punica granatum TaxID=22663 RepID=A0A2I0JIW0_PUNGR|nr:hypothetical protein CRG98_023386 [Punica granatum]